MNTMVKEKGDVGAKNIMRTTYPFVVLPGSLVQINDEVYRVPSKKLLKEIADYEEGREETETVDTVEELFDACGVSL